MKIQKVILILLCPLFLNACSAKEASLPTPMDKPSYTVEDMDLRFETLQQDAKRRGVSVSIRESDVVAAREELTRIKGQTSAPPLVSIPKEGILSQSQEPLSKQDMAKTQAINTTGDTRLVGGHIIVEGLSFNTGDKKNQPQELQFPKHTVLSFPVVKATQTTSTPSASSLASLQGQAPPPPLPPLIPKAQAAKPKPAPNSYNAALGLYRDKQYREAELAFNAYLKANPEGTLAPNALYWKGETFYARGDYPQAIFAFKEVQTRYPKHPKAPDSLLKTAMSYGKIGDTENAGLHYLVLGEDFPNSAAAKRIPK